MRARGPWHKDSGRGMLVKRVAPTTPLHQNTEVGDMASFTVASIVVVSFDMKNINEASYS